MARKSDEKYRETKKNKILESARLVFCRKGYLDVTMQDIIDECKISRGGIYLYYPSVSEIFRDVASSRNKARFAAIRKSVDENLPFRSVLKDYLTLQKIRLLNMENSLLRAMYEYIFSRAEGISPYVGSAHLENIRSSVLSIFSLGVKQNEVNEAEIYKLTDHFVIVIEGLGIMALTDALTEKMVDEQFEMLYEMIGR
ncbi:MAG: TetR/AcrR family transcriptional regulator [Clostridiales bacterium]|jgi:AcrR family transcriptional regulator|nr:TetR/AcrR family transcriptional regulator [Clostridiales bacterium]